MRIDRIKFAAALAKADLNIKQLSQITGLSRNTITAVKSGKTCAASTAKKLAACLGSEISDANSCVEGLHGCSE